MNADENPFASPNADDSSPPPTDDGLEGKRRYRVAWMWGANGCGYLTMPWWSSPDFPSSPSQGIGLAIVSLALSLIVFVAAIGVFRLGELRDFIGALCGIFFGASFLFICSVVTLCEIFLGIGVF